MKKIISMEKSTEANGPDTKNLNAKGSEIKEKRLKEIGEALEDLKMEFAKLVDEYEYDGAEMSTLDVLGEALAAVDDAIDGINDVLM